MIFYFSLWIFLAIKAFQETKQNNVFKKNIQRILFIFLSLLIGFRDEVGCDWSTYIKIFDFIRNNTNNFALMSRLEPSYLSLNIIFSNYAFGYYLVNLVVGIIFSFCLIRFCASLPRPWLGLCIALPYFIVVVGMGYTRQSVAIAISILSFLLLEKGKFYRSILLVILGATFHRSALIFLFAPLINIGVGKRFTVLKRFLIAVPIGYYLVDNFIIQQFDYFRNSYLDNVEMSSTGSLIRIILCVIPSFIYILYSKRFNFSKSFSRILKIISIFSFLSLLTLQLGISNTAVDRVALNFLPIQFIIGSHLPDTGLFNLSKFVWKTILILFSLLVFFVWLTFAKHAFCWIPYQNILFNFN